MFDKIIMAFIVALIFLFFLSSVAFIFESAMDNPNTQDKNCRLSGDGSEICGAKIYQL